MLLRDVDQAKFDLLSSNHLESYKKTKAIEDLPGAGQWYCVECSRWFEMENTLVAHKRGKPHKRRFVALPKPRFRPSLLTFLLVTERVKQLQEEPYTQKEAEAAVGLRTDNGDLRLRKEDGEVDMTI